MEDMKRRGRSEKITIRCTALERESLRANAGLAGVSVTEYILYMTTRPISSVRFENTVSEEV